MVVGDVELFLVLWSPLEFVSRSPRYESKLGGATDSCRKASARKINEVSLFSLAPSFSGLPVGQCVLGSI